MVLYLKGRIPYDEPKFFVSVLGAKIFIWGAVLAGLFIFI